MLRIRLRRIGAKKHPSYRIVVTHSQSPGKGAYIEEVGHYDPGADPPAVTLEDVKVREWLNKGAQPSEPVRKLLQDRGISPKD